MVYAAAEARQLGPHSVSSLAATVLLATGCYLETSIDFSASEAIVCTIVFLAAAISSIAGFAFSAIAAAVLLHFVADSIQAVQILLVSSIAIQSYCVLKLWRHVRISMLAPTLFGGLLTLPVGLYLLLTTPLQLYQTGLGIFLVLYSAFMLWRPARKLSAPGVMTRIFVGSLGGVTGPIAAFPGALVTIWCSMLGWDKETQRALYQPYILGMQILTLFALQSMLPAQSMVPGLAHYILPALVGAVPWIAHFHLPDGIAIQ